MLIPPPPQYSDFGNTYLGNCSVVAAANIVQERLPKVSIFQTQVIATYQNLGGQIDKPAVGIRPVDVFSLWETQGLWGTHITGYYSLATDDQIIEFTHTASVYAVIWSSGVDSRDTSGGTHAVLIDKADANGLDYIRFGIPQHESWDWWHQNEVNAYVITGLKRDAVKKVAKAKARH